MIILDTDCLSLLEREKYLESSKFRENLSRFSPEDIATTIITFEEQMRGWLAYLARCKTLDDQVFAYEQLNNLLSQHEGSKPCNFIARIYYDFVAD
ncbi:MAG: hypothetical protein ACR2MG_10655 [Pyrinomonadaceae bacterium]